MIISHRWKFIFIKTRKTAGTSVEIALSSLCGADDVITPITAPDEVIRAAQGGRQSQNIEVPPERRTALQRLATAMGRPAPIFYNHMPASAVRRAVAPAVWAGYFKFAFERNPWDKVLSAYHWQYPAEPRPTVEAFVASRGVRRYRNSPLYIDGQGALLLDHVARYEDLAAELESVRARLGLPPLPALSRAKGAFRDDRRRSSEALKPPEQARIAALFSDEIARFGYRCE